MKPSTKEHLKYLCCFIVVAIVILQTWIIVMQDDVIAQKEYYLNVSQTAFKIQSSTLNRVSDENLGLRQANECLITYSYRDRCITSIKHTPLPKLLKEVK